MLRFSVSILSTTLGASKQDASMMIPTNALKQTFKLRWVNNLSLSLTMEEDTFHLDATRFKQTEWVTKIMSTTQIM